MERSLEIEEILDLLSLIRDALNKNLHEKLKAYYVHSPYLNSYQREGLLFIFSKRAKELDPLVFDEGYIYGDYGILRIENEKIIISISLVRFYTGLSGDVEEDEPYIQKIIEKLVKIATVGFPKIERRIERDLPKELYLNNGRFTLTLEKVLLSFGVPLYQEMEYIRDDISDHFRGLNIEIVYDMVDEEEWAPPDIYNEKGGKRYKEGEKEFIATREK